MVLKSLARFREFFYIYIYIYVYSGSGWHAITFERFLSRGTIVRFLYQEFRSFLIDQLFRGTPIFRDKPSLGRFRRVERLRFTARCMSIRHVSSRNVDSDVDFRFDINKEVEKERKEVRK